MSSTVAIVTGGSRGIGAAVVRRLAAAGHHSAGLQPGRPRRTGDRGTLHHGNRRGRAVQMRHRRARISRGRLRRGRTARGAGDPGQQRRGHRENQLARRFRCRCDSPRGRRRPHRYDPALPRGDDPLDGCWPSTAEKHRQPVLRRRENRISRGIRLVCGSEGRGEHAHRGVGRRSRTSRNPVECSESGHGAATTIHARAGRPDRATEVGARSPMGRPAQPEETAAAVE